MQCATGSYRNRGLLLPSEKKHQFNQSLLTKAILLMHEYRSKWTRFMQQIHLFGQHWAYPTPLVSLEISQMLIFLMDCQCMLGTTLLLYLGLVGLCKDDGCFKA